MTYIPIKPNQVTTALTDADTFPLSQGGTSKIARLDLLRAFIQAGSTGTGATGGSTGSTGATSGTTGSTGGSTGTTGGSTGGTAPAGRLGYAAPSTVVRNASTSVVPVNVPAFPTRSLPAYTAYNANESPNGKVLDASNYSTDRIVYRDGTVLTLVPSSAGLFSIRINGNPMAGRVDLVNFYNASIDDAKQVVYWYHRSYFQTDHGLGDTTWLVIEGDQSPLTDCDTEGDDPRKSWLIADVVAPVGDPPYGLGSHAGSIGDEPRFGIWLAEFTRSIGVSSYVNAFSDSDVTKWGNDAYTAAADLYDKSVNKSIIPVYGLVMCRGGNALNDYNAFARGDNDQYIKAGVKGYLEFFDEVHARPGYESNGTFMNWFWGGQNGDNTLCAPWLAAFKRIITVARQAADEMTVTKGRKKTVLSTWNPCHQNYNAGAHPRDMYPGNDYVDYHGLDIYSPQYTQDNSNWKDGGFYPTRNGGPPENDKIYWQVPQALEPINRIHFWDYPAAKYGIGGNNETGGSAGWGMQDAIIFAKECGKPLAFPECGAGQNFADAGIGPVEDYVFPYYLRSRCDQAVNMGVPILYANIWCADEKDGGWGCLFRQRVRTQYAWSNAFGGTGAALKFLGSGASGSGSAGSTGGSTGSTGGSTGSAGMTGGGSTGTSTGSATAIITDTSGHAATITLPVPPAAGEPAFYGSDTGLSANMYWYNYNGQLTLGCSAPSVIASIALNRNSNNIIVTDDLLGVTTYSGSTSGSGSTAPAGGGSGVATVSISDNAGHTANLTLNQGYRTYNGSGNDTNLSCNIFYYSDTGNGNKPTIGSSADGTITSMVITRNGTVTVASGGLAGVTTYV